MVEPGVYEDTLLCGHVRCYWLEDGEVISEQGLDFGRAEQLWDFLGRVQVKDRTTWVFAHSLGYQLTLLDFWRRLDSSCERHLWSVLSDPPTIICTVRSRRVVKYVDTMNYFRERLPLILGWQGDRSSWELDPAAPVCDHIAWCRKVSKALGELLCRMIRICRKELQTSWQCTAASLSWSLYRRSYLTSPIFVHGLEEASTLETHALFGGVLQVSKLGNVNALTTSWDVNSLYPHVMATKEHPNKLVRYYHEPTVSLLHNCLSRYYCVAEISMEIAPYDLPFRRGPLAGWSRASGQYVLCGDELRDAAADGMVFCCHRLATYETADLFSGFVGDVYPRKVEASVSGDMAARWLWKMILNGLSGKFAQRSRRWTDAKEILAPGRWANWWYQGNDRGAPTRCRAIAGRCQRLEKGGLKRDSMPVVAASISSGGRSRIRALAALAGKPGALYIDCDSIHLGERGSDALAKAGECDPRRIGALKLVASGPDAYYWGPKHYRIGDWYVSNVVQLGAKKLDDGYWLQQTKRGLECTLASGVLDRVIVKDHEVRINGVQIQVSEVARQPSRVPVP